MSTHINIDECGINCQFCGSMKSLKHLEIIEYRQDVINDIKKLIDNIKNSKDRSQKINTIFQLYKILQNRYYSIYTYTNLIDLLIKKGYEFMNELKYDIKAEKKLYNQIEKTIKFIKNQ